MWKKLIFPIPLLILAGALALAGDKADDIAIVVNPAFPLSDVTGAELAKILKAEKAKSAEGVKFLICVRESGTPERNAVLKAIYKMTDAEYEKFFLQATFSGAIQAAPKQLSSVAAVRHFICSAPGAISYMRASDVDASVKVLKIEGKAPGDDGYPISAK